MNSPSRPLNRRQALRAGAVLALGLTGCATTGPTTTAPTGTSSPTAGSSATGPVFSLPSTPEGTTTSTTGSRTLLAYFSRAGENYHEGGRRNLEVGNSALSGFPRARALLSLHVWGRS